MLDAGVMTAPFKKTAIGIEALLQWAYADQAVEEMSAANVWPQGYARQAGFMNEVIDGGGGGGSVDDDAIEVMMAVNTLRPKRLRDLVIYHAKTKTRPTMPGKMKLVPELKYTVRSDGTFAGCYLRPTKHGIDRVNKQRFDVGAYAPLVVVNSPAQRAVALEEYEDWWHMLKLLRQHFQSQPRTLRRYRVMRSMPPTMPTGN